MLVERESRNADFQILRRRFRRWLGYKCMNRYRGKVRSKRVWEAWKKMKCKKENEVVPGIELGLPESESDVLTSTLYNHVDA